MRPGNRYFYFDEAADAFLALADRSKLWRLARMFALVAGMLLVVSVVV